MTPLEVIYFLLPTTIGYSTSMFCNIGKNAGTIVKFRPPSYVFGIVWFFLFILLGLSWVFAVRTAKLPYLCIITYFLASLSLGLWTYVYGCKKNKKGASWVLILSLATLFASLSQGNDVSKVLLSPLIAWVLFAMIMNTTEVTLES